MPERTGDGIGVAIVVAIGTIFANDWNPNVQPDWVYDKELASIAKFGFVDPLIVRELPKTFVQHYEIIDGFHRWKAAVELGYTELPCWNLGVVDDADAREMTVVLNETRGKPDEGRLRVLLEDLIKRRGGEESVREIMPFSRQRFDELVGRRTVDWAALEARRASLAQQQPEGRWKESVFRTPYDAAKVVEDAIDTVREREGFEHAWQALQMICADSQV